MIVGTAGHVDHGKTSLVRALTGVDTDRLPEEKARGISIDLGFAYMQSGGGRVIGFVDVPGHEKFVSTMVAGATGIDLLMLTVAADDGFMPQTREHLAIADLLGLDRGIVVMTKVDLASPERRRRMEASLRASLVGTALHAAPIVAASATTGEGLDELREALARAADASPAERREGRFRLAVDRSFTLAGAGTIVTGTVLSGSVTVGDRVTISPRGLTARVRSIHAQNRPAERGDVGERCALNLAGIERNAVARGDVAVDPGLHAPADRIDARVRVLSSETKPVGTWLPVRFHHGTADMGARLVPLAEGGIAPGSEGWAQIVLERPIAAAAGDRFILRDTSAQRTIGGGLLVDLRGPNRKRRSAERYDQLAALAEPDPDRAATRLLDCPPFWLDLSAFCRDRALAAGEVDGLAQRIGARVLRVRSASVALSAPHWTAFGTSARTMLASFHAENPDQQGMGLERLRLALPLRLPRPVFDASLGVLSDAATVAIEGSWARLPGHTARMTPADETLWARVEPLLAVREERFRPPRVRDIARALDTPEESVRKLLKTLGRAGKVDEIAHDHFFARGTVTEMVGIARTLSAARPRGDFTAAEFRDQVDNGRKVAIQILEFFDRQGVTIRRGDLRRMNRYRLDLFGLAPEP